MNIILLNLLCTGMLTMNSVAAPLDLSACDQIYSARGDRLIPAAQCYQGALATASDADKKTVLERAFIALSAAVNDGPKTQAEIDAIALGLKLVGELERATPGSADLAYWRAVFVSFDAMRKDRGSVLPKNLFAVLKSLQQDLRSAISLDPKIHVYGPHRVLGIMHTQMPGIVGGDKSLAENLLLEAYQRAPELSGNHVAYAKILMVNGKDGQAKMVLERFLAAKDSDLDPYPSEPLRGVKPELERDRKTAKTMLQELNEDE
jgi:hypothetical protein